MIKCEMCGKVLGRGKPYKRNYCESCKTKKDRKAVEDFKLYQALKNKMMVERAVKRIEGQTGEKNNFEFYRGAIEAVKEYTELHPDTLASTEETICAIVLIADEIHVKCQEKIGKHRVDFILPELKIVLEVDGYMHKYTKLSDSKRDLDVLKSLGTGWEIIRIPTKYIDRYPQKVVDAIFKLKEEKQKLRKINGGNLSAEVAKILQCS